VDAKRFHLADFDVKLDGKGMPSKPQGQKVDIQLARKSGWQARFDPEICASCLFTKEEL